ncbi:hypothetical protein AAMO2058_001098700 [Amorphochlora amoebiformis]
MADLLDDILAGVEDTYKDVKPQESKEKNLSIRERQMSKFQAQMQRRALAQINNFRAKIQERLRKFKSSDNNEVKFPNVTEDQKRFVIHEVAAEFSYTSRDEESSDGSGVRVIAVYKEAPPATLEYDDLSEFQKAELTRQAKLIKSKKKKKSLISDPEKVATGLVVPKYTPKDRRSVMQIVREEKARRKEQKKKEVLTKAGVTQSDTSASHK